MFDQSVEFPQVVTGYRCIHVVFDVVVHVPIEELEEWIEQDGPAADSKIGHVILQPDMLGGVAGNHQPFAVHG